MRVRLTMVLSLMLALPFASTLPSVALAQQASATGENDFRNWLKSLESHGIRASFDAMNFDPASESLTISNLAVTFKPTGSAPDAPVDQITFAKLSLTDFSSASDGYQFTAAAGDGLAFGSVGGPSALTIAHIEAGKSYLPSIGGFNADPQRPITSQIGFLTILSKTSIESFVATDIAAGASAKARDFSLSGIFAGKISDISLKGFAYGVGPAASSPTPDSIGLAVNEFAVTNVDIAAYMKLFDESAYLAAGAAKPWSNFFEAADLKGLAFKNGPVSFSVDSANLGALKVRQFPQNLTAIFDNVARDPGYLQANPEYAQTLSSAVRQSFLFEKASLANLVINAPNKDGIVSIAAGSAAFSKLTATHVDQLTVGAFKIADAGGTIGVRALQLGDVNLPLPAPGTAANAGPLPVAIPTVGSVKADGLDVNAGGMAYGFDQLNVSMSYFIGTTPTNVKASLQHVRFPVADISNPGLRQTLTGLGYSTVDLSIEASVSWQDSASSIDFDSFRIAGADMGTINLSGSLTGVTRNGIEHPASALGSEIIAGGLENFRLSFEDASLVERVLAQIAKANNKSVADVRKLLSTNMSAIMGGISVPAIRNKFVFAAVSFLNAPEVIELSSSTSDNVPLRQLMSTLSDVTKLPVILKLDVRTSKKN